MITTSKQISVHFHSSEFVCQHCGQIKIDENLVNKMEHIFSKLNASKCIISSGYRCPTYDTQIGGFAGRHSEGLAADCIYYDKDGKIIPSKIVICVAYDLGELNGIAKINDNYVHLDNRNGSTYRGDETRGNSSYWTDPYLYFGVSKTDVAKYTGEEIPGNKQVNVYYKVKTQAHGWLPEVKNLEDYAGYKNSAITGLAIKVDKGSIKYRVHVKGGSWLGWISKYDINDYRSGYAGNNKPIDAIQVYYYTPNNIRPYKKAKYKVNNYSWQTDTDVNSKMEGWAGQLGVNATKLQISIE